ncbi:putative leucine-rich repeat-containing protein DDB_G0290503 [Contarinia nasturtii]|uniref:putative leucine-rich repeat-containing protein DDB_G0290503 n=1 Tax=Contarinia nasturtii TaxID=265458 RepID=UPI0012D47189|nr:putative leucine-rich repeat-containing protein DDB_G0290503 [Contarinia nasturtii]
MDVPGLSLFQGAESIKLNTEQQRIEEEDAIEDRKRRNEELKNELENAFDDLAEFDDDEDTMYNVRNSSVNGKKGIFNGRNINHKAHLDNRDTERATEILQLKNMLASKNEELRNINVEFTSERTKLQNKIDELNKRFAITEAEKERSNMNRAQTHQLFVESKQKLIERDEQIAELNAKIKSLDARNLELVGELERTKSLLSEIQHKYHMFERNAGYTSEKHTDIMIKQLNDQHAAKTDMMQQQINTMRTKLEDRESELKRLLVQNNELHSSREAMLLDKSDTINQLSKRLDESQRQVQEMIMKNESGGDLAQENIKLLRSVTNLQQQNREMQQTINDLTLRLESTTTELDQLTETAIHNVETISSSATDENQFMSNGIMDTPMIRKAVSHPRLAMSSTPLLVGDRITRLKLEFNRCVTDQKAKRQEILALKEELMEKNREIDRIKADENRVLIELNINKEENERFRIRLKNTERELDEYKNKMMSGSQENTPKDESELLNRLHKLERDNENFRSNCNHLNETIRALEDERDHTEEKYREACKDIAELQQKISRFESNSCLECEKQKFLANEAKQECLRIKELYVRISDEKEDTSRRLRQIEAIDINKELLEQRNMVASLERSLQLAEMKCTEVSKILEREKIDHEIQIQNMRAKYEQEIFGIEKEQKDISNSCRKCVDLGTKIAKYEMENLQLQTTCSGYTKDINELKKSLKKADQTVADLTSKLALKLEHDQLLDELKNKASQFEEFMRNQSPTKSILTDVVAISSQTSRVRDQCVSTEDLLESPRSGSRSSPQGLDRSAEKKIRQEMSRAMAIEVKSLENEFKEQILNHKQQINDMQATLKERETDISNLKTCILKERHGIRQILDQKDQEQAEAMKKHQAILLATRNELDAANKRIETLMNELEQSTNQFQAERDSVSKLMAQWKAELAAFAEREENLNEQMQIMESSHAATVQSLNEKYVAAKKTAANYKRYSDDKEKHIERESERIKQAYEKAVEKVKESTKVAIKEHEKEAKRRIAELQGELDTLRRNCNSLV